MGQFCTSFPSNFLLVSSIILLLSTQVCLQAKAQALCLSQFALANEACSFLRPGGPRGVGRKHEAQLVPQSSNHHRSHHHGSHDQRRDPEDSACCRRLSSIDNACVCEVMRRLPLFISRPTHTLVINPLEGCEVSYQCGGLF